MKTSLRRNLWRLFVGCTGLLVAAAILFPVFARVRENDRHASCQSNLKNIGLGFMQYSQDYDGKFPTVALKKGKTVGWVDALFPYLKSHQIDYCPQGYTTQQDDPHLRNYTDYWMNGKLSGVKQSAVAASALTVLNGDGNDGADQTDARYNIGSVPLQWIGDKKSPLYRHLEGCNYGFADGHVKWIDAKNMQGMDVNPSARFRLK